ncbi:MAG: isochorismate synthase [Chloroflexota bacterium]|nr:MAG: isochorismate synthase [Chloroflexota bacterium]
MGDWGIERVENESPISDRQLQLISVAIEAPGVTAVTFLHHARGRERFFWQAAHEAVALAGFGVAADWRAWGAERFQSIEQQARTLFDGAIFEDGGQPLAAPRLFGGFSFADDFVPDNTWAFFHPAHFILPHYQLAQVGEESWLTINAVVTLEEDVAETQSSLREALLARLALLQSELLLMLPHATLVQMDYPMPYAVWQEMIERATAVMRTGDFNKVVLSRVCELWFDGPVDVTGALAYLNQTYPDCYRFLFEPRPHHAFYGATPELLVQVDGRDLHTMALAGSIRRGQTAAEDESLAQELLASQKDAYEHAVVADSIRRRLTSLVAELEVPEQPTVLRLGYIQHLYTPVYGRLPKPTGILPLVEILHPTPALGGAPRHLALPYITQAEPVPRGWYAAPVGTIDHHLDGAFAVGIRSAIAQDRRVWLHAGAGIVADSQPQKEWDETALKFRPMLNALGIA